MPPFQKRFSQAFGRRKSTGNVLDEVAAESTDPPEGSSFSVIPRGRNKNIISFDNKTTGDARFSHASSAITRQVPDTASSSVRYSSTSTVPSSFGDEDQFSPSRQGYIPKNTQSSPELFAKTAAISHAQTFTVQTPVKDDASSRDRALTTSSYASTAVPPKLEAPLPALSDNSFDDFDAMFSDIGDDRPKADTQKALPQPPQRTFQRTESEPLVRSRKPVGSGSLDASKPSSPAIVDAQSAPSPDLNRKSTDLLIQQGDSGDSYPSSPEHTPDKSSKLHDPNSITLSSAQQTLGSSSLDVSTSSSVDGDKQSRRVSFNPAVVEKSQNPPPSRGSDSGSLLNASALEFVPAEQKGRQMSAKAFAAMKERQKYDQSLRLNRGQAIDDEGPTIYEDVSDDEDKLKKQAKEREIRNAKMSVNRQKLKKTVGREDFVPPTSSRTSMSPPATRGGASPDPAVREDHHLLPYAHNMGPVAPADPRKRLTSSASLSTPNLPTMASTNAPGQSSGEDDEDTPLAFVQQALVAKDPEMGRRVSTVGSLADGRASITPSHLTGGASSARLSVPAQYNRPKSRASTATQNLPPFARGVVDPDQLPLMPGFQGPAPGFPGPGMAGPSNGWPQPQGMMHNGGGFQPQTPGGGITYQTNFGGAYAQQAPQATLMDRVQEEERRKKNKFRQPSYNRSHTAPNPQGFNNAHMSFHQMNAPMGMTPMGPSPGTPFNNNINPQFPHDATASFDALANQPSYNYGIQSGDWSNFRFYGGQTPANIMAMTGGDLVRYNQVMASLARVSMYGANEQMNRASLGFNQNSNTFNAQNRPVLHHPGGNQRQPSMYGAAPSIANAAPSLANVGPAAGYAPSIAPSERSNVGMPSRYKTVTTVADNASVGSGRPMSVRDNSPSPGNANIQATLRPGSRQQPSARRTNNFGSDGADDDADAENEGSGWGAMKTRRARHKAVAA